MRFDVLTLFPELFTPHLEHGVTRRAFSTSQVQLRLWQLRDFADDAYRRVDDRPFGGGPGMVMMAEPLERALTAVAADRGGDDAMSGVPVVHFTPAGRRLDQALVVALAQGPGAVMICGRYEGVDQRVIDRHVTLEISLGDYVLSGGELAALVLLDAIARLQAGVLTPASRQQDSFSDGLLEGPSYTRPEVLADGTPVPEVLLSGHHGCIERWRRERSLEWTARRRPDLIEQARIAGRLDALDEAFLRRVVL
ncbi:MAG: tRNA ((1)-)-methyltransferase [Pseudomonadota bacterium]|jgi:tRNA (guanine37-N1)-methyltransferase